MLDDRPSPCGAPPAEHPLTQRGVQAGSALSLSVEEKLKAIAGDPNLAPLEVLRAAHKLLGDVFEGPTAVGADCGDSLPRIAEFLVLSCERAFDAVSDPQHLNQLRVLRNQAFGILGRHVQAVHHRVEAADAVELIRHFAAAGAGDFQLFERLSSILMRSVDKLSSHEKVSVLSAYTRTMLRNRQLVGAIASSFTAEVATLSAGDVSVIARSCDENKIFPPELLKALSDRVQSNPSHFQVSHLSTITHLFVSAGYRDLPFFESIAPIITAADQHGELAPKERRSFVSGIAGLALASERRESTVERVLSELLSAVEAPDMLRIVSRLYRSRTQNIPERAFEAIELRIISLRNGFGGRDIADLLDHLRAAGRLSNALVSALTEGAVEWVGKDAISDSIRTAGALRSLPAEFDRVMSALDGVSSAQLLSLSAADTAKMAALYSGSLNCPEAVLQGLSKRTCSVAAAMSVEHLLTVTQFFVGYHVRDQRLFEALAARILQLRGALRSESCASLLWGLAKLKSPENSGELQSIEMPGTPVDMVGMKALLCDMIDSFTQYDLPKAMYAAVQMGADSEKMYQKVEGRFAADLACCNPNQTHTLSPGGLASILSLVAKREAKLRQIDFQAKRFSPLHYPQIFIASAPAIRERIKECSGRDVANIAWAFASARVRDVALFNEIAVNAIKLAKEDKLNPHDVSSLLHSFAVVNIPHRALACELANVCDRRRTLFGPQDKANTAWGLAFSAPDQVCRVVTPDTLDTFQHPLQWMQVYQALIISGQIQYDPQNLPDRYLEMVGQQQSSGETSFQLLVRHHVSRLLQRYGLDIRPNQVIAGVETDIEISEPVSRANQNGTLRKVRKVAVECDGDRFHMLHGPDADVLLGKDRQQDNLFRKCGWEPVHISSSRFYRNADKAILDLVSEIMRALDIEEDGTSD